MCGFIVAHTNWAAVIVLLNFNGTTKKAIMISNQFRRIWFCLVLLTFEICYLHCALIVISLHSGSIFSVRIIQLDFFAFFICFARKCKHQDFYYELSIYLRSFFIYYYPTKQNDRAPRERRKKEQISLKTRSTFLIWILFGPIRPIK